MIKSRWGGHEAWRVSLDGAAQEEVGKWTGLVALRSQPHQQVVRDLCCSLWSSWSGDFLKSHHSKRITSRSVWLDTTLQVRIGEWKVLDTNSFDRENCYYYDSKTEAQCDGARFCRRRCRLENAKIDCIPSSQGQEVCSEEVQVDSCQQWEITNYLYTRLKAASQLHLPSCQDLQIGPTKVTSSSDFTSKKGDITFRLGQ